MDRPLKIVHVISALTKGGAEKVAVELANSSAAKGQEVSFILGWPVDAAMLQNLIDPKIEVRFVAKSRSMAMLTMIPWIFKNSKWIFRNNIMHCHLSFGSIFGTASYIINKLIFFRKGFKVVETNHAIGLVSNMRSWRQKTMYAYRDGIVLMAKDDYWEKFRAKNPGLPTTVIYNGISVPEKSPAYLDRSAFLAKYNIPANAEQIIGTISMLRPERIPLLYPRLFEMVYQVMGDKVHFVLGGDGAEMENLKNFMKDKPYSKNFHLVGLVQTPADLLAHIDIYVSLCVGETAGISMIEAGISGAPVVAYQLSPTVQEEGAGWFWWSRDEKRLADKIIQLLKDEEHCRLYAAQQKTFIEENLTARAMCDAYLRFYNSLH
jgi:glycosyltransferase involved in cell wall biosynthesis